MAEAPPATEFKFYHADRAGLLSKNLTVSLCERGLSPFGRIYAAELEKHLKEGAALSTNAYREHTTEQIRLAFYSFASSRYSCFFGANYLEEAVRFARIIEPVPTVPVRIFEVFATRFVTLDMHQLDFDPNDNYDQFINGIHSYWTQRISNHGPPSGNRKPPSLEVLMHLPVRIGKKVFEVDMN